MPAFLAEQPDEDANPAPEPSEGSESSDLASDRGSLPALLSIRVAVVTMQGPTCTHSLWTQEGEDIERFMVRADILLNPDSPFMQLLPVEPQPSLPQLTLLLCPRWWSLAGIKPLLVQGPVDSMPPFFLAAHQMVDNLLPTASLPDAGPYAVYAPAADDTGVPGLDAGQFQADALAAAAYVVMRPVDVSACACHSVGQHLASLSHVPRSEAEGEQPLAEPMLAVLLGFGFDQILLTLEFGSVPRCIARLLGIPFAHVYIQRQRYCFDKLTVAGRRPTHCFGFRNLADMHRPFQGIGVFFDARPIGRPLCFREIQESTLTPAQLCAWLQVDVPEGYRPFCSGGVSTAADDGSFTVAHGNTILVWVDTVEPRLELSPSTTTTTVMTEDHGDEDDAAQPRKRCGKVFASLAGPTRTTCSASLGLDVFGQHRRPSCSLRTPFKGQSFAVSDADTCFPSWRWCVATSVDRQPGVRLCLITYNVLTLLCPGTYRGVSDSSPAAGMRMYGKRDLLKQQLDESGAHFVALQETRVAGSQELPDADYFMLHSSCTASGQVWYGSLAPQASCLPLGQWSASRPGQAAPDAVGGRATVAHSASSVSCVQVCSGCCTCSTYLVQWGWCRGPGFLVPRFHGPAESSCQHGCGRVGRCERAFGCHRQFCGRWRGRRP